MRGKRALSVERGMTVAGVGLAGYAADKLELGHVAVPFLEGHSERGMYHRSREPRYS